MSRIAASALELIGNTPLVRLNRMPVAGSARILVKVESLNPGGSIKDRIALAMIEAAETAGTLKPGDTIIEPTSGNTGVGLALVAAIKGYRLLLTMPEDMSMERRNLFAAYGADFVLTPAADGMGGAVAEAKRLSSKSGYFLPQQFANPANPEAHRRATAREILDATDGEVDALVAGIGTGGTITGIGEVLKAERPGALIIGVEPERSAVISGRRAAPHKIQGIGAGFIPEVLNVGILDEVIAVSDDDATATAVRLAREEGLLAGISSGANVFAALAVAARIGEGKTVVTILADTGERYLSLLKNVR
jgi:cysteine synthase A